MGFTTGKEYIFGWSIVSLDMWSYGGRSELRCWPHLQKSVILNNVLLETGPVEEENLCTAFRFKVLSRWVDGTRGTTFKPHY